MRAFSLIWSGQLISMVGTRMSHFALLVWLWERTQAATPMTLMGIAHVVPALMAGLVAGALVDRWDRKRIMMVSDLLAGLTTVGLMLLYLAGTLQPVHLYLASAVTGLVGTFQQLAYSAAITTLIPKAQYARASGMISLAEYASVIAAPLLAGLLIGRIGLAGVLVIDILTFLFAVTTLFFVPVPGVRAEAPEPLNLRSLLRESFEGFRYIFARPSLTGMMVVAAAFQMAESLGYPLIAPMILARTGSDEALLGGVQTVMGIGGVLGGAALAIWGGPKRRIHGVLIGLILTGLLGDALMGAAQTLILWLVAGFCLECFIPLAVGSYQAIWRSKIPPAMQGRAFAARNLISGLAEPVSMLMAGLLVDGIFEPAMQPGGTLVPVFGGLVGTGAGAGMGLMLVFCGLLAALAGAVGYLFPALRRVESLLPDHDSDAAPVTGSAEAGL